MFWSKKAAQQQPATSMPRRPLGNTGREITLFGMGGALEALVQAREQGRVRHLGLTGHHDPAVLLEALRRFPFDTVLVALNAADVHRLSFARTVLPEAVRQGVGVIGMKVCAQG